MTTQSDVENIRDYKDLARVAKELGYGKQFEQLVIIKNGKPSGSCTAILELLEDNPGLIEIMSEWIVDNLSSLFEKEEGMNVSQLLVQLNKFTSEQLSYPVYYENENKITFDVCNLFLDKELGLFCLETATTGEGPITNMTRKPHPSLWHNLKDCAKKALLSLGRHVDSFVLVCQAQKQHETMLQLGDELS